MSDRFWGRATSIVLPLVVVLNELNHLRKKWSHR